MKMVNYRDPTDFSEAGRISRMDDRVEEDKDFLDDTRNR